jgi:glyoxylase-like metal-dependent hydrolase (beta-lactamase superfamily II)
MKPYICVTCGAQYPPSSAPPAHCIISEDEREFVDKNGPDWTTREEMFGQYNNQIKQVENDLFLIRTEPLFAIGQRAFLVRTPNGNILWDCITHLDQETIDRINQLGGLSAIAISHPHMFATMIDWSHEFGDIPIYIHEYNRCWVVRPDKCVQFWNGATKDLFDGKLRLVRTGGHFKGSQVLWWPSGANGKGVLLSGDEPHICMDPKQVTFMHSYPNYIPLSARTISKILKRLQPLDYDRIYCAVVAGGASEGVVSTNAKLTVQRSGERYIKAITDNNADDIDSDDG